MTAPLDCGKCPALAGCRTQVVPGYGKPNPLVMFVGQNPGRDEDKQGRPFVGRSGALLALLCEAALIPRSGIYRTNAVRCLSPGNRKPKKDEIEACRGFLIEEIKEIQPSVIVTLGEVPLISLYGLASYNDYLGELAYWEWECETLIEGWQNEVDEWVALDKKLRGLKPKRPKMPIKPKPAKSQHIAIKDIAGHMVTQPDTGVPMIPSYHPAFLMRGNWGTSELVIAHLEKARKIAEGILT